MRKVCFFFLCFLLYGASKADTLNFIFRLYDEAGAIVPARFTKMELAGGTAIQRPANAGDPWQHWTLTGDSIPCRLTLLYGKNTLSVRIDVLEKFRNGVIQSLVVNRLQDRKTEEIIKVNQFTCSWTAGIAYALEYRFINPIDKHELKFRRSNCLQIDSANVTLSVLSDSVMLLTCGSNAAVFFKYRVDAEGYLYTEASGFVCTEFHNQAERALYKLLTEPGGRLRIRYENNDVVLEKTGALCEWVFSF